MKKRLLLGLMLLSILAIGIYILLKPKEYMVDVYDTLGYLKRADLLGAARQQRPTEFTTSLAEQKTEGHSDTTLKVTSITTKDDNTLSGTVLGTRIVLTINSGSSNAETIVCTGLTAATKTFTGCTFGYRFDQPLVQQSSNIEAHAPGEPVIISNTDTYNAQIFLSSVGDHNVLGLLTFDQHPQSSSTLTNPTSTYQYVTKNYVDNVAVGGDATSSETQAGRVELATQLEMASSSPWNNDAPTILQSRYATATPYTSGRFIPISNGNGQLDSRWFYNGSATTTFYSLLASSTNISNIGYYNNAFRNIYASGTLYIGSVRFANVSSTLPHFSSMHLPRAVRGPGTSTLWNGTIDAGQLGDNGIIRLRYSATSTDNDNVWQICISFGGCSVASSVSRVILTGKGNNTQQADRSNASYVEIEMGNKNSASSQYVIEKITALANASSSATDNTGDRTATTTFKRTSKNINTSIDSTLQLDLWVNDNAVWAGVEYFDIDLITP